MPTLSDLRPRGARAGGPRPGSPIHAWLTAPQKRGQPAPATPVGRLLLASAALQILGAVLVAFVAQATVLGSLKHSRDQRVAYDDVRLALAEGSAPVGPANGKPIALGTPVAQLQIPSIGVKEVVLAGTTSRVLQSGVGYRRDSVLPGQRGAAILMGRRMAYGGPFRRIGSLQEGAEIKVVTGQGDSVYKVLGVRHAGDPQPVAGAARLTLITTDGFRLAPKDVVRVDADLVGPAKAGATPAFTPLTLPKTERALSGEPGALGPVTGWGFLLVCAALLVTMLRETWGRWPAWLIGVPTLGLLGLEVAHNAVRLLPNMM